jgi:hypothetical protein
MLLHARLGSWKAAASELRFVGRDAEQSSP